MTDPGRPPTGCAAGSRAADAGRPRHPADGTRRHLRDRAGRTFREWDQTDYRGPIRANLLTVDLNSPNITVDYLGAPYAVRRQTVTRWARLPASSAR